MAATVNEIASAIDQHIKKSGGSYSAWYVGIAEKPRGRLFEQHSVRENGDWWIHRDAGTAAAARQIEDYFVNQLGTDGGTGGGSVASRHIYGYKKASHTRP